jgi:hypothetical protein
VNDPLVARHHYLSEVDMNIDSNPLDPPIDLDVDDCINISDQVSVRRESSPFNDLFASTDPATPQGKHPCISESDDKEVPSKKAKASDLDPPEPPFADNFVAIPGNFKAKDYRPEVAAIIN